MQTRRAFAPFLALASLIVLVGCEDNPEVRPTVTPADETPAVPSSTEGPVESVPDAAATETVPLGTVPPPAVDAPSNEAAPRPTTAPTTSAADPRLVTTTTPGAPATTASPTGPRPAAGNPQSLGRCSLFGRDNYWYANVSTLPVHARSAAYVQSIGAGAGLKADFGSGTWDGGPIGIPYVVVAAGQPKVSMSFDYADESDPGPYPIPADAPIEGGPGSDGDRHVLVVDQTDCRLYETWSTYPDGTGGFRAGSGAMFDLASHALRPEGWTSSDAAGLPVLPGLVRYDEVAAGRIDHAIRITVPRTQNAYVWPARHQASSRTDPNLPPMGTWLRLRADFDTSGFSRDARIILDALKQHGAIIADNGSAWYMSGAPDERWNNDVLQTLRQVPGSAFDVVDTTSLMVDPNSGQVR